MRKKDKGFNGKVILPLFIVFILVTSMAGFMWGESSTKLEYNGFKIVSLESGSYMLNADGQRIAFNYFPSDIEWINSSAGISGMFESPMAYFTSDQSSDYADAIAQIHFNFAQIMESAKEVYIQNAFTGENEFGLPAVSCVNATIFVPVILVQKSNLTEISLDGSCIVVSGKSRQEIFMAYERLLYTILGVME